MHCRLSNMPQTTGDAYPSDHMEERLDTRPNKMYEVADGDDMDQVPNCIIKESGYKQQRLQKFFKKTRPKRQRLETRYSPIDEASLLSTIWFSWMTPVFYKSWKGTLEKEDLFSCSLYDSAKVNSERLENLWQKELKLRGPKKASLAKVYFRFLAKRSLISCLATFISIMSNFISSAVLVFLLIEYCQQEVVNLRYGLMLAGGMVLCQIVLIVLMGYSWYLNIRTGGRVRAATVCMIYHKTIRLRSMKGLSIGEIVNLCTNDGQRLFDMLLYLPHALAGPPLALLALIYTIYLIGPAAILGTGVFILFFPLQALFSKIIAHYRCRSITVTDHRVRLMSEIISCIKLIKMYAWEESFAASIGGIRNKEQALLQKGGFFQTLCQAQTTMVPILSTVLTLCLHTLLGHNITAAQAFSYISVLNSIRFMIMALPMAMKSLTDSFVAFPRIKSLLLMDELMEFTDEPDDPDIALSMMNTTFAWDKEEPTEAQNAPDEELQKDPRGGSHKDDLEEARVRQEDDPLMGRDASITETLFEINLDIQKGQLLGICGSIGSGKSSLLQAVLSRMILVSGKVAVSGSFAYVAQQACIMNMSLRENILMGEEFNKERYAQVVDICALQEDLVILADGDETEIGERGINISGGQKQRVSLARAVYADKDIYLLDDPLSAVDAHVGKHIFSKCINTALQEKTVLFVTHQLQYLKICDRVILMKDGRIAEDGTHRELMENGEEYCNLIKTFHSEDSEDTCISSVESQDGVTMRSTDSPEDCDAHQSDGADSERKYKEGVLLAISDEDAALEEEERDQGTSAVQDSSRHADGAEPSCTDSGVSRIIISESDKDGVPRLDTNVSKDEDGGDGECSQGDWSGRSNTENAVKEEDIPHQDQDNPDPEANVNFYQDEETQDANREDADGGIASGEPKQDPLHHGGNHSHRNPRPSNIRLNETTAKDTTEDKSEGDDKVNSSDCSEGGDLREDDNYGSTKSSPVKTVPAPWRDFTRGISAADACVDSEETIFYSGNLIEAEETGEQGLSMSTIHRYIQSAGGYLLAIIVYLFFAVIGGLTVFSSWWLSLWLNAGSGNTTIIVDNITVISESITDNPSLGYYQLVYGSMAFVCSALTVCRCYLFVTICLKASSNLHKKVFDRVVHSPMSFFDTTPLGRILNRFSNDLDELDINIPIKMDTFLRNSLLIFFSVLTSALVFPWLLIPLVFIIILFVILNSFFRHGIRDIKRFENVARSPWFSHIMTTVQSLSTIHAYKKNQDFIDRLHDHLDDSTNMIILFYIANRWMAIRFDMITILITASTALLAVLTHGALPAATVGLAIAYSNQLLGISQFTVRMAAEVNARFTSVERLTYYIKELEQEAPLSIRKTRPEPTWPSEGRMVIKNLKMRYRKNLPLVLKGITFDIKPNEKVGIVGRTGSGKSSLGVALYRLVEKAHGSILIDDVDISQIGLYDLRSKLSIIPQDPVLFIGTIRYNLDPQNKFADEELWRALDKTYMKDTISGLDEKLNAPVVENGENFSVGERQLLCMARALIRNSKILILDEATAAIDTETDSLVQQTIKQAFTNCTILTIAHRLNTILDSDRIMVLRDGKVIEFDSPSTLLANPISCFSAMISDAGNKTET